MARDDTGRYGLTAPGEAALAAAAEHVNAFRRGAAAGVTPEEYATTVRVLQRMAANLDT